MGLCDDVRQHCAAVVAGARHVSIDQEALGVYDREGPGEDDWAPDPLDAERHFLEGAPEEVAQYGHDVRRRLVVKPGLTGLWQVSGRSDLSWEESVRLDLRYVENWSLTLDIQILWKTWSAVIRGAGAY